jgi:uncharacterized protein YraI
MLLYGGTPMPTIWKKAAQCLGAALFVLLFAVAAQAQEATVTHNVNLRSDPSTSNPSIRLLKPTTQLTLIDSTATAGYYHVKTDDGTEGWVWSKNVQIGSPTGTPPTGAPSAGGPSAGSAIPSDWDKPDPVTSDFNAEDGTCAADGNDVDSPTNLRKNRTDVPSAYHEVPFSVIAALPFPKPAPTRRIKWSSQQLAAIKPYEGVAISIVGYIAAVKTEGAESTNCGWTKASEIDWHIPLVEQAGQGEPLAIVVETTPRIRTSHPNWTTGALGQYATNQTQIRISGWLMFDPDHPGHLGKYRTTLWEIHPITKIEAFVSGHWVDLDK